MRRGELKYEFKFEITGTGEYIPTLEEIDIFKEISLFL